MADIDYSAQRRLRVLEKALGLTANEDIETVTPITGGSGSPGAPIVRKFPFAYNTPNLLTGAPLYTPTIGDILLAAWVEIDLAWDGTTPLGDIGPFISGDGWLSNDGRGPMSMLLQDVSNGALEGMLTLQNGAFANIYYNTDFSGAGALAGPISPAKFTAANPIKFCVSQDGSKTGADPGSTQGSAALYLVTATPV